MLLNTLSPEERELFTQFGFAPTIKTPYSQIHHAFEDYAQKHPHKIAVTHLHRSITYGELHQKAEALASQLTQKGIGPGDNVGLFLERSIEMIIGLMAILKTGAAYIPQDARITPHRQLNHIINLAQPRIVLTLEYLRHNIPSSSSLEIISIDQMDLSHLTYKREVKKYGENCFILFTSGTTGMPNGVKVTHKNVCNLLLNQPGNLGTKESDVVSQILNISFDMAAWEIFTALSYGATLLIRGKSIEEAVTRSSVVISTPSILSSIDEKKCQKVRVVAVAGEPCPRILADKWSHFCTFYNSCGPTEVTIVNTMKEYNPFDSKLTIGKPTPNNTIYILNEDLKPCKIGEVGEIWAGGDCVTNGYLKNSELTSDRYRPDPFLGNDSKMFRTRDLGRWTPDGELEHYGRTDDQVKIKGFRVELDSISRTLESTRSCRQAVTLKLDSENLVSFVRPSSLCLYDLDKALKKNLPYFYHPSHIIPVDNFPFTDRGKIDKRKLIIEAVQLTKKKASKVC